MTTINVTAADIAKGTCADPLTCVVALAVNRGLKDGYHASVGPSSISIWRGAGWDSDDYHNLVTKDIPLPIEVRQFISDFDTTGNTLSPFSFPLDIPAEYCR